MGEAAAHPVWACDDDAIKEEYRRALSERDYWLREHQRVDAEAERLHHALERLLYNAEHIFDKRPVGDWDETLGEARRALNPPETTDEVA